MISAVVLTHNSKATMDATLASLTWCDEIVVIDDGSTDGTADLVSASARADTRVRLLRQPHEGIVAALQAGLGAAAAPLIARMDADDESYAERFAAQIDWLARGDGVGLVGSLVDFGGDRVTNAGYALHVDWMNSVVTPSDIRLNRFVESPLAHPSVMFRR